MVKTRCGKELNSHGEPFTVQGLRDHTINCPECITLLGGVVWRDSDGAVRGQAYKTYRDSHGEYKVIQGGPNHGQRIYDNPENPSAAYVTV